MDHQYHSKKISIIFLLLLAATVSLALGKYALSSRSLSASGDNEINNLAQLIRTVSPDESFDIVLSAKEYGLGREVSISDFEKTEAAQWSGEGVFDDKIYYQGLRSLGLISNDRKAAVVKLAKKIDLTDVEQIEFMLHVNDVEAFEAAAMDFGDSDMNNYFSYALSGLKNGWNLVRIPKEKFTSTVANESDFSWVAVENVKFSILSRPKSILFVRLDMLRGVKNVGDFLEPWHSADNMKFLSLFEHNNETVFLARNSGVSVATIKGTENARNFIFSASVSPQSPGRSGLFVRGNYNNGYGYYFLIGGDRRNNWQIIERNQNGFDKQKIVEGVLNNQSYSKDNKYWLRAEARGEFMEFYISFDGREYEKLGEIKDSNFRAGETGIAVLDGGWSLFNDFAYKKL